MHSNVVFVFMPYYWNKSNLLYVKILIQQTPKTTQENGLRGTSSGKLFLCNAWGKSSNIFLHRIVKICVFCWGTLMTPRRFDADHGLMLEVWALGRGRMLHFAWASTAHNFSMATLMTFSSSSSMQTSSRATQKLWSEHFYYADENRSMRH